MMLLMRKDLVVSVKDLRFVRITCQSCNTQITLDFADYQQVGERRVFTPRKCPACKLDLDTTVQALDAIQERYAGLAALGDRVVFCIPADCTEV